MSPARSRRRRLLIQSPQRSCCSERAWRLLLNASAAARAAFSAAAERRFPKRRETYLGSSVMTCSHCIAGDPLRASDLRFWERPVVWLTRARPYRCHRCGCRRWFRQDRSAVPSSVSTTRPSDWMNSLAKIRDRRLVPKVRGYLARTRGVGFRMTDLHRRLLAVVRRYVLGRGSVVTRM